MKLNEAVKELRGLLNESQQAFATRLGISIRGLVNYEKDRDPPLALLLKLAAVARAAGNEKLADVFQWAFYEAITEATRGHGISFLQEDERAGEIAGLLLMTFARGQFEYVSAFSTALKRMLSATDAETRDKARKALETFVQSISPGLRPATRKK
jgi:transcriptional regulator with XRE-family HTH domain